MVRRDGGDSFLPRQEAVGRPGGSELTGRRGHWTGRHRDVFPPLRTELLFAYSDCVDTALEKIDLLA